MPARHIRVTFVDQACADPVGRGIPGLLGAERSDQGAPRRERENRDALVMHEIDSYMYPTSCRALV